MKSFSGSCAMSRNPDPSALPRLSRRGFLAAAGSAALLTRAPLGWALGPSNAVTPAFVDELIGRMTVEEKAGQLTLLGTALFGDAAAAAINPQVAASQEGQLEAARTGRLTGIFNGSQVHWHKQLQDAALQSRLKIPMIFAADVIHGFRTVFPVPLGEAASFEPDLAERTARAAAIEATACGLDWTFAPMVDVARDARWSRGVEGAGEDVLVNKRFAAARVRGFQGSGRLSDPTAMLSCPKHFAAYGAGEAGLDYNTVDVSERTLREVYFPPFQAGFDAGALSTMAAFNELSGIPATGNTWLMSEVLRGEWNFRGLVVSDYTGDMEMMAHGYAADEKEAVKLAILAGVDMSMQSGLYMKHLPALVAEGAVPIAKVDESVRRVLTIKALLGLFDDPYRRIKVVSEAEQARRERIPAHTALTRECARRSVVLLKNDNAVLPLKQSQKIALIGPFASGQHDLVGPWTIFGKDADAVDFATGLRNAKAQVTVVEGSEIEKPLPGGIEAAVAAANAADVVVLALGEPTNFSGEAQSRTEVVIPEAQQALAEAVAKTGKPIVVVLRNGRALALKGAVLDADAILVAWFLGTETGNALADVLLGDYSPSGRLPVSFPQASGQSPYYYAHKNTGRPNPSPEKLEEYKARFRDMLNVSRFPFGHGLTYGKAEYGSLDAGGGKLAASGKLDVSARVRNSGKVAIEEVVQLYIRDRAASITRPVRELKDFRKIALKPGEAKTVRFTLQREDLLFIGVDHTPTVEPGMFDLWIAPSAEADGVSGTFELTA
jgi:beta-glucosidase